MLIFWKVVLAEPATKTIETIVLAKDDNEAIEKALNGEFLSSHELYDSSDDTEPHVTSVDEIPDVDVPSDVLAQAHSSNPTMS
jgi:hypothetical protein